MEPKNENTANEVDNHLIISAQMDPDHAEKPINEELNGGYNSSDDTGNSNEDLELNPDDDPRTNLDPEDLEALNGLDIDEDETM